MTFKIICDGCNAEVNEGISPARNLLVRFPEGESFWASSSLWPHWRAQRGAKRAVKGCGGIKTALSEHMAGAGYSLNPFSPSAAGSGLGSRHATAAARHSFNPR